MVVRVLPEVAKATQACGNLGCFARVETGERRGSKCLELHKAGRRQMRGQCRQDASVHVGGNRHPVQMEQCGGKINDMGT